MLKIENLKIYEDLSKEELIDRALKKASIKPGDVISCSLTRKSIDARDKNDVHYSCSFEVEVRNERKYPKLKKASHKQLPKVNVNRDSLYNPVIIGAGPAGLFCALTLVEYGYKPIIIEQGDCVDGRIDYVVYTQNNSVTYRITDEERNYSFDFKGYVQRTVRGRGSRDFFRRQADNRYKFTLHKEST